MMRPLLIQTFWTNNGKDYRMGFSDDEEMLKFLIKSLEIHCKNYNVIIYCDEAGYNYLRPHFPAENLILFDFTGIKKKRFWNTAKILVQQAQTGKYIHCDIDAVIYDLVDFDTVLTEMYRSGFPMHEYQWLGLKPVAEMMCSGIIGFADMELKNEYCNRFLELVNNWKLNAVTHESRWSCEELLPTNMLIERKIRAKEMPKGSYKHLQGGAK